jgi:hypothetical protein
MYRLKIEDIKYHNYEKQFKGFGRNMQYEITFLSLFGIQQISFFDTENDSGFSLTLQELIYLTNEAKKFSKNPVKNGKSF